MSLIDFEADFGDFLHPLDVVRVTGPGGAFDADGRQTPGKTDRTTVQGLIRPISGQQRMLLQVAGGIGLVPSFMAFLPLTAPVGGMDYHLEFQGLSYYPWGDAADGGADGSYWEIPLGSPGQRRV